MIIKVGPESFELSDAEIKAAEWDVRNVIKKLKIMEVKYYV